MVLFILEDLSQKKVKKILPKGYLPFLRFSSLTVSKGKINGKLRKADIWKNKM